MKIKILAMVVGISSIAFSCNNKKESCHDEGRKSHHKKEHGDKKHHFEKGHRSMNPDSMAKFRTEMMKKKLDLTEEQIPKVEQLNIKYANKKKEIREQMKQLEEERRAELSGILTKEQMEKLSKRRHHKEISDSTHDDN